MATSVDTLIENQQLIAQELAVDAASAAVALLSINTAFTPNFGPPGEIIVVPPGLDLLDVPSHVTREFHAPAVPTSGSLTSVPIPVLPDFPADNTPAQPAFTIPGKPTPLPAFVATVPAFVEPADIANLDIQGLLAAVPSVTLTAITLPDKPTLSLPEFSATKPGAAPTAPTDLAGTMASTYQTALNIMGNTNVAQADSWFRRWFPNHAAGLALLETRLDIYLQGGSGVDSAVADSIYEMERGKRDAEYRRVDLTAQREAGKRGQFLPDAVLLSAQIGARTALADANALTAADIRKMQFDLEQKNLQFAVATSKDLRTSAMQTYQGIFGTFAVLNGQAIDYAKAVVSAIVETFNAAINGYRASMEGYKVEAEVYAEKIKVELAKLEVYKAELEGEKAKVAVDELRVRLIESLMRKAEIAAEVYKSQVEAAVAKGQLQKLKFDAYDSRVRSFAALVQAKEAEYRGYAADISGQTALQQSWAETVRARTAEIQGYQAHVTALAEQTRALLAYNDGIVRQFEANIRAYAEQVRAEQIIQQSDSENYKTTIAGIAATNQAKGQIAQMDVEKWRTGRELSLKAAQIMIEKAYKEAEVKVANLRVQADALKVAAEQLSRMAQAALSGINGILSKTSTA